MFSSPWAWSLLAAVPVAVIALYFLKLKRQPVEVPSTYLWAKSIEDLHVNSIWQRLRQSLLLLLQLLLLALAVLALLRPYFGGSKLVGARSIFLIDTSASMSSLDVSPSRLDEAKRLVAQRIETMESGDTAMIIAFSDESQVVQPYTESRKELQAALAKIKPTQKSTDIHAALRAASGLANPGRTSTRPEDFQVAEPMPATMYLYTDGNFPPVSFSLGNLEPVYVPLGVAEAKNVAITAFNAQRNDERPDKLQVYASLENHGADDVVVRAELFLNDQPLDVKQVEIAGKASTQQNSGANSNGVVFELDAFESGVLRLEIAANDDLRVDDKAWVAVNTPRRARILCLTPGNEPLELALRSRAAQKLIHLTVESPDHLKTEAYRQASLSGMFDLIIFDRCVPAAKGDSAKTPAPMPLCNTLFIGAVPKLAAWGFEPGKPWPAEKVAGPSVIDVDRSHPLMQLVELGDVLFAEGVPLKPPPGGSVLIDTVGFRDNRSLQAGLLAIGPREGFEDAILGFNIVAGGDAPDTNWALRYSFPVFVFNAIKYLGVARFALQSEQVRPGKPVNLKLDTSDESVTISTPGGQSFKTARSRENTFDFIHTDDVGVYEVRDSTGVAQRFAVNLFDSRESDLPPQKSIDLDWRKVEGTTTREPARQETWKYLLLLALVILVVEWYIYNRRVYL